MTPSSTRDSPIRVVLVDDQTLMRTAFRLIFDVVDDIDVVGEAGDGAAAVDLVRRTRPDVVLMDLRMPGVDGIEATRAILALPGVTDTRVLVLTVFDHDEYVYGALRAGASGFLLKDVLAPDLVAAVRTVATGESVTAPTVTRRLIAHFVGREPIARTSPTRLDVLTPREREVLVLIAHGRTNAEIGQDLRLTASTVSTHIGRILAKLDLRDRVQAVILGYECGLVP